MDGNLIKALSDKYGISINTVDYLISLYPDSAESKLNDISLLNNGSVSDLDVINYINESIKVEKMLLSEQNNAKTQTDELTLEQRKAMEIRTTINNYLMLFVMLSISASLATVMLQISIKYVIGFVVIDLLLFGLLNLLTNRVGEN